MFTVLLAHVMRQDSRIRDFKRSWVQTTRSLILMHFNFSWIAAICVKYAAWLSEIANRRIAGFLV